jgi:hypothetical protein
MNNWKEDFKKQFIREDGLLNIGKYDDEVLMDFIQRAIDQTNNMTTPEQPGATFVPYYEHITTPANNCCNICRTPNLEGDPSLPFIFCGNSMCKCHTPPANEWREEDIYRLLAKHFPNGNHYDYIDWMNADNVVIDGTYDLEELAVDIQNLLDQHSAHLVERERKRIEEIFKKEVPPHAMDLEDSVWLRRLLNKAFGYE